MRYRQNQQPTAKEAMSMASFVNLPKKQPVIWIATDDNAIKTYAHIVDDECDCETCESKKSHIILTQ